MRVRSVSGYTFVEKVGVGAESAIYRAREGSNGRTVAIKHIEVTDRSDDKYLRHVENEFAILRDLREQGAEHQGGIVLVYDLLRGGRLRRRKMRALVMEFVPGKDLRSENRYPLGQHIDFFRQVAESIRFVHRVGYIHGDIKPENIIVRPDGRTKLVDFGFSCKTSSLPGSIRGTRQYLSPEQAYMEPLDERTDIHNFGATMYHLLTGRHVPALISTGPDDVPFIASRHVEPVPVRQLNGDVPETLSRLVTDCCKPRPEDRPSSVDDVISALEILGGRFSG